MADKNIEIEIKVNVENPQPLLEFLEKNGIFQSEKRQIDEYFSPAHKNFVASRPVAEWLRLRDAEGKYSINYKNWHIEEDGKSHYCDEFETIIDSMEKFKKIFSALDFKPLATVDKVRKTWRYKDYEIAVDSVKNLGDFVEIEYWGEGSDLNPKKITQGMVNFLKEIGCGKIKRNYVGYPFLVLFPDEAEYEME